VSAKRPRSSVSAEVVAALHVSRSARGQSRPRLALPVSSAVQLTSMPSIGFPSGPTTMRAIVDSTRLSVPAAMGASRSCELGSEAGTLDDRTTCAPSGAPGSSGGPSCSVRRKNRTMTSATTPAKAMSNRRWTRMEQPGSATAAYRAGRRVGLVPRRYPMFDHGRAPALRTRWNSLNATALCERAVEATQRGREQQGNDHRPRPAHAISSRHSGRTEPKQCVASDLLRDSMIA